MLLWDFVHHSSYVDEYLVPRKFDFVKENNIENAWEKLVVKEDLCKTRLHTKNFSEPLVQILTEKSMWHKTKIIFAESFFLHTKV